MEMGRIGQAGSFQGSDPPCQWIDFMNPL